MAGFGGWLLQRRLPRIAMIAFLFPLGLMGIVSAAVVVFVAELKGWRDAGGDCLIALGILVLVAVLLQADTIPVMLRAGSTWIPAVVLGAITGIYGSLTLAMQVILVAVIFGLILFGLWVDDPIVYWQEFITDIAGQLSDLGVEVVEPELLMPLAPLMTGAVGASVVISAVLALLLGSWWASKAGGSRFRQMFTGIRLGHVIGGIAIVSGVATLFDFGQQAPNILLVLGVGFAVQGLSVLHWQAATRQWPGLALAIVYLPLLLGPSIVVIELFVLATLGFLDNWFGLRRAGEDVV